jgi:xanthine dehydrogenase accessory factor
MDGGETVKDILPALSRWLSQGEEIALATVLKVHRSAPRPAGARLGMTRSGRLVGSVSSGCVEADVFQWAMQVMDSRRPVVIHYGIADEWGFQVGLSCGGAIDVLIEPFVANRAWEVFSQAVERREPVAFAVGLAPDQLLSQRMTVTEEASGSNGSIDPYLDDYIVREGRRLLSTGGTEVVQFPWGEGGEATVFIEALLPPPRLFIVGATHTAIPLCRMAKEVGFEVTVIDARSILATRERFPDAHQLVLDWPDEALGQLTRNQNSQDSYVVVLTHDTKFDIPALTRALSSSARYIGALGGRVTHEQRKAKLRQLGFTEEALARIRSPIGLDLGARTPEELAVAILAEMLSVRHSHEKSASTR